MATVYADNTNKAVNTPSDLVDAIDNGAVYVFSDSYEASSLAQNSLIAIAKLPPTRSQGSDPRLGRSWRFDDAGMWRCR